MGFLSLMRDIGKVVQDNKAEQIQVEQKKRHIKTSFVLLFHYSRIRKNGDFGMLRIVLEEWLKPK
jgi:hypothetical protein